jgi:hypothetical protein
LGRLQEQLAIRVFCVPREAYRKQCEMLYIVAALRRKKAAY